jgi:hypothetical protein
MSAAQRSTSCSCEVGALLGAGPRMTFPEAQVLWRGQAWETDRRTEEELRAHGLTMARTSWNQSWSLMLQRQLLFVVLHPGLCQPLRGACHSEARQLTQLHRHRYPEPTPQP